GQRQIQAFEMPEGKIERLAVVPADRDAADTMLLSAVGIQTGRLSVERDFVLQREPRCEVADCVDVYKHCVSLSGRTAERQAPGCPARRAATFRLADHAFAALGLL